MTGPLSATLARAERSAFDEMRARRRWIERIGEVLRFPRHQAFAKLHDAHRIRRPAVIGQDEFGDPQIAAADDAPDRETLCVGLDEAALPNVAPAAYSSGQIQSFALHAVAETLNIPREQVADRYDDIERDLLTRFFEFVRDRRQSYWVHWNMRSLVFGFEHLEHRYRILTGEDAPVIPIEVRLNLNDTFKARYGSDYAADPKLKNLMALQGDMPKQFMEGAEESEAFRRMEFIRMNASTIAKVQFFRHAIELAKKGKLTTAGSKLVNRIDRLLESRWARVLAFTGTCLALTSWVGWLAFQI